MTWKRIWKDWKDNRKVSCESLSFAYNMAINTHKHAHCHCTHSTHMAIALISAHMVIALTSIHVTIALMNTHHLQKTHQNKPNSNHKQKQKKSIRAVGRLAEKKWGNRSGRRIGVVGGRYSHSTLYTMCMCKKIWKIKNIMNKTYIPRICNQPL